jgi:hypothetical protein
MITILLASILAVVVVITLCFIHLWIKALLAFIIEQECNAYVERATLLNRIQTGSAEKAAVLNDLPKPNVNTKKYTANLGTAEVEVIPDEG